MTIRGWREAQGETTITTQVVVVGSGPGGAAVSRALAERGAEVWILEEGPPHPRFRPNAAHTNRYHMQENGMMVAQGTGFMPIAAGRGVGGGSLVNSALSFRTPDDVLHGWRDVLDGDDRYGPTTMRPIFDELEALLGIAITPERIAGENSLLIVRGAKKLGLHASLAPRNTPYCSGCGICNFGCPTGGKASVDRNLIPMAQEHGATVQADVKVDTILVEEGRAVGVTGEVRHTDTREPMGRLTVRADKVIVACGGIGTPRLLHTAGVAERMGDRVGRGLHVHPGSAVLGLCDHEVHMWRGATQGAYFEDPRLPGVLPHTMSAPPGPLLLMLGTAGEGAKAAMSDLARLCGCVVMISDHGEGRVRATSDGRAKIEYWFDEDDIGRIKAGMEVTARVLLEGGAHTLLAPVAGIGRHTRIETFAAALADRAIGDFALYASHPMASCRMGADPSASVVGVDAQAHHLPGLYIADSSVFPTSLGVNPQLTTMALGTAIGQRIPL